MPRYSGKIWFFITGLVLYGAVAGCRQIPGSCSDASDRLCVEVQMGSVAQVPHTLALHTSTAQAQADATFTDGVMDAFEARGQFVFELDLKPVRDAEQVDLAITAQPRGAGQATWRRGDPLTVRIPLSAPADPLDGSVDGGADQQMAPCVQGRWCQEITPASGIDLSSIWGTSDRSIWAVGQEGTILHWDGLRWRQQISDTSAGLTGVWGTSDSDVWAVGYFGTVVHWDGMSWQRSSSGTMKDLHGVWTAGASSAVWAVGSGGMILK